MFNFFYIAKNSVEETIRQPLFYILLLINVFLNLASPYYSLFVFHENQKMILDSCMATSMVLGLSVAVLVAGQSISREIRNGTVMLLMSKPVSPIGLMLGKILGIQFVLALFMINSISLSMIALRIGVDQFKTDDFLFYGFLLCVALALGGGLIRNYFNQSSFPGTASLLTVVFAVLYVPFAIWGRQGSLVLGNVLYDSFEVFKAFILVWMAVSLMGIIAMVLSIRLSVAFCFALSGILFLLGLVSTYFFAESEILLFNILYFILPNWQLFWLADALSSHVPIPAYYLLEAVGYTLSQMIAWGALGIILLQNKETAIR